MHNHSLRSVNDDCVCVWNRVSNGQKLNIEWADIDALTVTNCDKAGLFQQPCFFNAIAGQPESDCRSINRKFQFTQQELQSTDMIFMTMRCNTTDNAVLVLN